LEARVYDGAGNAASTPTLSIRLQNNPPPPDDRTPPRVSWLSPAGGSILRGAVELTLAVIDSAGIDSVRFFKNGATSPDYLFAGRNDTLYSHLWNTENDSDGIYVLEARAWDRSGNLGFCPALVVRVANVTEPPDDRTPPRVEWLSPSGIGAIRGPVTLSFKATDDTDIHQIWIYKNGFSPEDFKLHPGEDSLYAILWDTRSDSDGTYALEIRAWDEAGNIGISSTLILQIENHPSDQTPPTLDWLLPAGWSNLRGETTLRLRVVDNGLIDSVRVFRNGFTDEAFFSTFGRAGVYEFLWATESDSDGVYLLEARAWDKSQNRGVSPGKAVRVANHPELPGGDRTPPRIRWIAPAPGSVVRNTISLQFGVADEVGVDSAQVYIDGELAVVSAASPGGEYEIEVDTWRWSNGRRIVEVRAYDAAGNVGIGAPVGLTVDNHRVFWIPDDFETIQEAVDASVSGDTIMVREGTWRGQTQFFDKNVSLISESGPELTILDGTGYSYALWVTGGQDSTMMIRGFTILNEGMEGDTWWNGLLLGGGASARTVNNIFIAPMKSGIVTEQTFALIRNNLFVNTSTAVQIAHSWGDFINNMIVDADRRGFHNAAGAGQPLIPDYNLFWDCVTIRNNLPMEWGEHNIIDREPLFDGETYRLRRGSPGIDEGDPNLQDLDGTRSDIGVYGGPYAYR